MHGITPMFRRAHHRWLPDIRTDAGLVGIEQLCKADDGLAGAVDGLERVRRLVGTRIDDDLEVAGRNGRTGAAELFGHRFDPDGFGVPRADHMDGSIVDVADGPDLSVEVSLVFGGIVPEEHHLGPWFELKRRRRRIEHFGEVA